MPQLYLHNSLSGQKERFVPINPSHIRLYACGPTVYNYAHIGNGRAAVVFALLADLLRTLYPKVTYVSNITDIDDKIIARAAETGEAIDTLTRKYETIFNEDMAALGARKPDIQPRATETIADMIALIEKLIAAGHAYEKEGHVMFAVPSYEKYGCLSGRSRDEQIAGARVEIAPYKNDPADFILWKPSTANQPGWDSPWGRGRPGWHIECSAMSEKYLGLPFDIHGGGADLKFPHHENEIAQSVCAHGHEDNPESFAKYWIHNGFLTMSGTKMSKSIGNIALVHDLLQDYDGEVLRLTLLSAHYRQPLDWSEQALVQSQQFLDRLYSILHNLKDVNAADCEIPASILDALCDDLNTPKAIAALNGLAKDAADQKTPAAKGALLAAAKLLNLLQKDPMAWLGYGQTADDDIDGAYIDKLLEERTAARAAKNFARADEIRDELTALNIVIEDTPNGPQWRKA